MVLKENLCMNLKSCISSRYGLLLVLLVKYVILYKPAHVCINFAVERESQEKLIVYLFAACDEDHALSTTVFASLSLPVEY